MDPAHPMTNTVDRIASLWLKYSAILTECIKSWLATALYARKSRYFLFILALAFDVAYATISKTSIVMYECPYLYL